MFRVGAFLICAAAALGLAACGALGVSSAQTSPGNTLSYAASRVHHDFGFGCPGGHLQNQGAEMAFSAMPLEGTIGYASNTGGVCAKVSASTSNIYNAPPPPSGWSAILYVEIKMADRYTGTWSTSGPQEFIKVHGRRTLHASAYYCARWFVANGSQWNEEWTSQTTHAARKKLILAGTAPNYTPYFNSQFVLKTETVLEVLEPPADDQC